MIIFLKKSVLFVVFFALFTLVINGLFLAVIANTDWEYIKRRETLNFQEPTFDLLVVGTSLAEYGIDTKYLTEKGIESYNMSLVGSSIKTSYMQLKEYLEMYESKPEYVMLPMNAYMEAFDQEGVHPMVEFTMKGHTYTFKDLPISKFGWAGTELLKKLLNSTYRKTELTLGHKKSIRITKDVTNYKPSDLDIDKYRNAKWIAEIAKLCGKHGMKFILIEIPAEKYTQNDTPVGPFQISFDNGHEADLYNYNNREFCEFIDIDKDWSGMSHFNKYGAEKFTALIYEQILNKQ